jgi:ACS family tartrate transporter-like MFS transporter
VPLAAAGVLLIAGQAIPSSVPVAVLVLCAAAMAVHSYLPTFWPLPTTFLTEAAAAASIGLINSFGNLGGFVGPYVVGFLTDRTGTYAAGIVYLGATALVGCALILSVHAARKRKGAPVAAAIIR